MNCELWILNEFIINLLSLCTQNSQFELKLIQLPEHFYRFEIKAYQYICPYTNQEKVCLNKHIWNLLTYSNSLIYV